MLFPVFRFGRNGLDVPPGVRMIREHSAWLTRMLDGLRCGQRRSPPRIPTRKVSEGGFAKLMFTRRGRHRAERWWERTLETLDD